MPKARFQSQLGNFVIDEAAGVIRGCRIATLNAVSSAAESDGAGLVMDAPTIAKLHSLAKANGDRVPAYFTHSWYDDEKKDPLAYDAGVWNDFALDTEGNLTATFTAFDTAYKAGIFSRAKADPQGIAVSPIFDYAPRNGSKSLCTPTEFISSDFVKRGAINKALFSGQTAKFMDINELIQALSDPAVLAALKAIIKSVEANTPDPADETTAADLESEAGVVAADKKPEDDKKPALMRAQLRISRCNARLTKALAADKVAILAEAKVQAAAETTALLGKGGFIKQGADNNGNEVEAAIQGYIAAGAKSRGVAIMRLAKDKPALYNTARAAGKI